MKLKLLFGALIISSVSSAQVPNYVPTNGLVGWWPFTGNANDLSGNGNNGSVNGATLTTDRNSVSNSAYSFNGTTNYISVNDHISLDFSDSYSYTISAWIQLNGSQVTYSGISCKMDINGNGYQFIVGSVAGPNKLSTETGEGPNGVGGNGNQNLNDGLWHNVVYVLNRNTSSLRSYIDGNLDIEFIDADVPTINVDNSVAMLIGVDRTFAYHFKGKIDDLGQWNRALSECEIQQLYSNQILSSSGTDIQTACDSYTWIDGNTYTASNNSATHTLPNTEGCDSIVTLDLTLKNSSTSTLNETALDSYTLNGQTYTQTGIYTQIIPNAANCDSTITLNLTMNYTGLEENGNAKIQIYPNPFTNELTIISSYLGEIKITNLLGVLVIVQNKESEKLTLSNIILNPGTYFLQQGNTVIKLIKQ